MISSTAAYGRGVRDAAWRGGSPAPVFLLDVCVLIALLDPLHTLHTRAHDWFNGNVASWASCALTENGALRIMSHPKYTNPLGSAAEAAPLLAEFCARAEHVFWACDDSMLESTWVDTIRLLHHAQITDTYLLAQAASHGGKLATFDKRLVTDAVRGGESALHLIDC